MSSHGLCEDTRSARSENPGSVEREPLARYGAIRRRLGVTPERGALGAPQGDPLRDAAWPPCRLDAAGVIGSGRGVHGDSTAQVTLSAAFGEADGDFVTGGLAERVA